MSSTSPRALCRRNAALLLPQLQPLTVVIGCVALSFPTNWLKNFSLLSFLSVFGLLCVFLICIVVGYQLFGADAAQISDDHTLGSVGGVPMAASIMLAGLTGHVGLPPMYTATHTSIHASTRTSAHTVFTPVFAIL